MRDHLLDSTALIRILARSRPDHQCERCRRPIWVRYASGLCVLCYNDRLRLSARGGSPEGISRRSRAPAHRLPASTTLH